jgi:hypothetical protein
MFLVRETKSDECGVKSVALAPIMGVSIACAVGSVKQTSLLTLSPEAKNAPQEREN